LDEFREKVNEFHPTSVTTGAWNAAKQAFLKAMPKIIKSLPVPAIVPKALLDKAQQDFTQATEEIVKRDTEIEKLTALIAALKKVKDKAGSAKVEADHLGDSAKLDSLIKDAQDKLKRLQKATPYVLFCELKGESAHFGNNPSSAMIDASLNENEIRDDDPGFRANFEKSKVNAAYQAVEALETFIDDEDHEAAVTAYTEESGTELDLRAFKTWRKLFHVSDPT
jgi:hypothetical protein